MRAQGSGLKVKGRGLGVGSYPTKARSKNMRREVSDLNRALITSPSLAGASCPAQGQSDDRAGRRVMRCNTIRDGGRTYARNCEQCAVDVLQLPNQVNLQAQRWFPRPLLAEFLVSEQRGGGGEIGSLQPVPRVSARKSHAFHWGNRDPEQISTLSGEQPSLTDPDIMLSARGTLYLGPGHT